MGRFKGRIQVLMKGTRADLDDAENVRQRREKQEVCLCPNKRVSNSNAD